MPVRTRFIPILIFCLSAFAPGAASAFENPKALVDAIYAPYQSGEEQENIEQYFSPDLRALLARHAEVNDGDVVGLDFDPFINAQGALIYDLTIGEPVVIEDRATVSVSFFNFDHPSVLSLSLVKGADGWLVDDVASMGTEEHWLLSWVLTYDPWAN